MKRKPVAPLHNELSKKPARYQCYRISYFGRSRSSYQDVSSKRRFPMVILTLTSCQSIKFVYFIKHYSALEALLV